jgi:hypothetical protein
MRSLSSWSESDPRSGKVSIVVVSSPVVMFGTLAMSS